MAFICFLQKKYHEFHVFFIALLYFSFYDIFNKWFFFWRLREAYRKNARNKVIPRACCALKKKQENAAKIWKNTTKKKALFVVNFIFQYRFQLTSGCSCFGQKTMHRKMPQRKQFFFLQKTLMCNTTLKHTYTKHNKSSIC